MVKLFGFGLPAAKNLGKRHEASQSLLAYKKHEVVSSILAGGF